MVQPFRVARGGLRVSDATRGALGNEPFDGPTVFNILEVDETLVGGRKRGRGHAYTSNKTWVAGAVQRGSGVRIERISDVTKTLHDFIARTVNDETEAIDTDELRSYIGIADNDTRHETVNHSAEERVVGDVHANSVEGV